MTNSVSSGVETRGNKSGGDGTLTKIDNPLRCSIDELRTLFLFEKLTDDQLDWLCENGHVENIEPGPVYTEGEPSTCCSTGTSCCPGGWVPMTSRPPGPRSAACTPGPCARTWATTRRTPTTAACG